MLKSTYKTNLELLWGENRDWESLIKQKTTKPGDN